MDVHTFCKCMIPKQSELYRDAPPVSLITPPLRRPSDGLRFTESELVDMLKSLGAIAVTDETVSSFVQVVNCAKPSRLRHHLDLIGIRPRLYGTEYWTVIGMPRVGIVAKNMPRALQCRALARVLAMFVPDLKRDVLERTFGAACTMDVEHMSRKADIDVVFNALLPPFHIPFVPCDHLDDLLMMLLTSVVANLTFDSLFVMSKDRLGDVCTAGNNGRTIWAFCDNARTALGLPGTKGDLWAESARRQPSLLAPSRIRPFVPIRSKPMPPVAPPPLVVPVPEDLAPINVRVPRNRTRIVRQHVIIVTSVQEYADNVLDWLAWLKHVGAPVVIDREKVRTNVRMIWRHGLKCLVQFSDVDEACSENLGRLEALLMDITSKAYTLLSLHDVYGSDGQVQCMLLLNDVQCMMSMLPTLYMLPMLPEDV
jgi:hypothetical protein